MSRRVCSALACAMFVMVTVGVAEARLSFKEKLTLLSVGDGPDVSGLGLLGADAFGPVIERLAIRGIDFPVTSTVPGFAYVYDPKLQSFERSSQLGPVFNERAETVGRGRIELGVSFLFASLQEIDGGGFGETATVYQTSAGPLAQSVTMDSFRIEDYVVNMYATYGITDRWDVNVLVPLIYSEMRVRATRLFVLSDGTSTGLTSRAADGDAFGVGDVLVRTKYRLVDADPVGVATALAIRTPSGAEDDFQGLGDVAVTPTLILSYPFGPHSLHGTVGMEFNADDIERTRARYTLGASFQLFEDLAFLGQTAALVDILGSSGLGDDEFERPGAFVQQSAAIVPTGISIVDADTWEVDRTDLIDLAAGIKTALPGNGVLFVGAIIPLNDDGIRADGAIPTGGVEFGF